MVPLLSIIFSTIYVYNSAEFIQLLVSQPIKRTTLLGSIFSGLAASLVIAILIGIGLPVLLHGHSGVGMILVVVAALLTVVFVALAVLASVITRDKAKRIGMAILMWFYFAIIFDGLVWFLLFQFADYPLENVSIALTALNPIDLSQILVFLQMDVSAMMGFTGAIFKEFFDGTAGSLFICLVMFALMASPQA